jgi:hypothetical protein
MSGIPYVDANGPLSVEVNLRHAADVFLLDQTNFHRYQNGQSFTYYGGHYTRIPVTIHVHGAGRWYLIVDGSDYQYRFY